MGQGYFRKITLTACLQKTRRGRDSSPLSLLTRYNSNAPWIAIIQTNENHHHFFIWISILGQVLVHSVEKTHVLVVIVVLIGYCSWYIFFNFVPTPNKSLRFARFTWSCSNRTAAVLVPMLFCLMWALKMATFLLQLLQLSTQLLVSSDSSFA